MNILDNKNIICPQCPNGCNISLQPEKNGNILIDGNKCEKGYKFICRKVEKEGIKGKVVAKHKFSSHSTEELKYIAHNFGVDLKEIHPKFDIDGSPERTIFRIVIEDSNSKFYIIEQIPLHTQETKINIGKTLETLDKNGVPFINPFLKTKSGEFVLSFNNTFWQIEPFIKGAKLNRTNYMFDTWRAQYLASFLIRLKENSANLPHIDNKDFFSIKEYIYNLKEKLISNNNGALNKIEPIIEFLENKLFPEHDNLTHSLCHGDYHPLNIIWSNNTIKAVIDWEFHGIKPEIYDVANMIGCLGIENPKCLIDSLVIELIKLLRNSNIYSQTSWDNLYDFIIALRFAWLSEWLRKNDDEMLALEIDYMNLLIENKDKIKEAWGI